MNAEGDPNCDHSEEIDVYRHVNQYGHWRVIICRVCDRMEDMPVSWRWSRNLRYEGGSW